MNLLSKIPNEQRRYSLALTVICLLCLFVLFQYSRSFLEQAAYSENIWVHGAWLTNYAGGFVRRGLIGEVLGIFGAENQTSAIFYTQLILYSSLYILLYVGIIFYTKAKFLNMIFLTFSSYGLFYYISQPWALGRGEIFFFLAYFSFVFLFIKYKNGQLFYVLAALLVLVSFFHENFLFFFGPLIAVSLVLLNKWKINFFQFLAPGLGLRPFKVICTLQTTL
jgi:hypothetical protein